MCVCVSECVWCLCAVFVCMCMHVACLCGVNTTHTFSELPCTGVREMLLTGVLCG